MNNYNDFVTTINKIFEIINVTKEKLKDQDNQNYIESIEEYKEAVKNYAELLKSGKPIPKEVERL
jgi:hypothetical protein